MKKRLLILMCLICFATPHAAVYASSQETQNVQTDSDGQMVMVTEEKTGNTITISPKAGDDVKLQEYDVFRITYYHEERDHTAHMDVDAGRGDISGYLEPGTYYIKRITYLGSNRAVSKVPAASLNKIRLYDKQVATLPLAIGKKEVSKLKDEYGIPDVYEESSTISVESNYQTVSEIYYDVGSDEVPGAGENPQSPIVDESVFGDDEEALMEYRKSMREQGYMDAYGNYTEKALATLNGGSSAAEESVTAAGAETSDSGEADSPEGVNGADVKTERFDPEESSENDKKEKKFDWLSLLPKTIPYFLLGLIGVLLYHFLNKKMKDS